MNRNILHAAAVFLAALILPVSVQAQICPASNAVGLPGIGDGCTTGYIDFVLPHIGIFKSTFTPACDEHDKCYSTLGTTYHECDTQFRSRMQDLCRSKFNPLLFPGEFTACNSTALEYYAGVSAYRDYRDPLPGIQSEALSRSRGVQASVEADICGTTPERTTLYSANLISQIKSSFISYAGREPTAYEFFDAVNAGDIVYRRAEWDAILIAKARQGAFVVPPKTSYKAVNPGQYEGPGTAVSIFADPAEPGVNYRWRVNGIDLFGHSIAFGVNPRVNSLAVFGYLKATSPSGVRNLAIVQRTFYFANVCGDVVCY